MKINYEEEKTKLPVTVIKDCRLCRFLKFIDGLLIYLLGIVTGVGLIFYYLIR